MSDGGGHAAPGWYPDPYQPSRLRYWDGEVWTEHYHQDDGKLPSVGDWLGSTFNAIGAYGIPAFALAVGGSVALRARASASGGIAAARSQCAVWPAAWTPVSVRPAPVTPVERAPVTDSRARSSSPWMVRWFF